MKKRLISGLGAAALCALALSGCAQGSNDAAASDNGDDALSIGFFGFAAANSFAQATYTGIEQAAEENGATSTFVDGQFDGQLQAQQINDAVTAKTYDVIIIQANDNLVVQDPLQKAVDAGITVVVEFVPVGPDFTSIEPQIDGAISVVDSPVTNGETLGQLGLEACEEVTGTCQVAYMEGDPSLPLDNARTKAVIDTLKSGGDGIEILPNVTGGYSQDEGRTAFQDILQAHPDVNVIIGSSQAVAGATLAAEPDSGIKFIGNGSPQSGVERVLNGEWFALYALDVVKGGYTAAEYGIQHAQGEDVPMATDERSLAPGEALGTKEVLEEAGFVSGYDE